MSPVKTVKSYIDSHSLWSKELQALRAELLKTELEENIKWGMPVYTLGNKNVIGLTGFKKFFGLWFYQGAFLKDTKKLLRNAQEGKTKGMRHLNYTHLDEVDMNVVAVYVKEAIANEKAGKRIKVEKKSIPIPPLLALAFEKDKKLAAAFIALSVSKQNDFKEHINTAKRESTKTSRIEKILPMIKAGVGLNDKYKKK